ncbi:solute carrier family 35 member C2 isoform X2 [Apis cerana]|uniref:solute carrier family 35 member C2 isoform X2 n=1 Tax=Apis cerana TaxID=7461 RepID=UPI00109BA6EC|nr:solute carrier family 35 member C2 isoform X2 [Apis cerana]
MTRSHIKYQIAKDADDTSDYFLQPVQELSNISKKEISLWKKIFRTIILIFCYFILSVGLTFYVQWLYNTYGFHFPLTVVICHLLLKFLLSALIRCIKACWKKQQQLKLPLQSIIGMVMPVGIASGLDVGLSNWAISLITMSLYTMTKSTTIIFILGFALFLRLEKKSWSLSCIVVMISGGLFMFTYKSTQFGIFGFVICLLASFSSGIRWTMTQLIMQKSKFGMKSPIDMMYYMQLWMLLPIVPVMIWFEGPRLYNNFKNTDWNNIHTIAMTVTAIFGSAIIAFHMEIMEFLVVTYTSSLTLSITGIIKEICILILAVEWKGDQMSGLNFIGLLMCLCGIIIHTIQKVLSNRNKIAENLELQNSVQMKMIHLNMVRILLKYYLTYCNVGNSKI